jgi:hypothetical protein
MPTHPVPGSSARGGCRDRSVGRRRSAPRSPRVGVGPERPARLSSGGFLRPALRTGRATFTASGSPRVHAAGAAGPVGRGVLSARTWSGSSRCPVAEAVTRSVSADNIDLLRLLGLTEVARVPAAPRRSRAERRRRCATAHRARRCSSGRSRPGPRTAMPRSRLFAPTPDPSRSGRRGRRQPWPSGEPRGAPNPPVSPGRRMPATPPLPTGVRLPDAPAPPTGGRGSRRDGAPVRGSFSTRAASGRWALDSPRSRPHGAAGGLTRGRRIVGPKSAVRPYWQE